jgi:hypothetical protein
MQQWCCSNLCILQHCAPRLLLKQTPLIPSFIFLHSHGQECQRYVLMLIQEGRVGSSRSHCCHLIGLTHAAVHHM